MSAVLKEQWWEGGRLHRIWWEPQGNGNIRVIHERLIPPAAEMAHAQLLEDLKFSKNHRARKDQGLHQIAAFTPNERDELHRQGVRLGDTDGVKWALRQDRYRHAKVGS